MSEKSHCITRVVGDNKFEGLLAVGKIEPLVDEDIQVDWVDFRKYLETEHRKSSADNIMRYCRRLHHLVTTVDGPNKIRTDLLTLRPVAKLEAMKALAALTRYMGVHDQWNKLRKQFGLRWSTFSAEAEARYFEQTFYNDSVNYTAMIGWIKKARKVLPDKHIATLDFITLTGLRAEEAFNSIQKLHDPESYKIYFNKDKATLEHFRFPEIFIRRTKKCYISLIDDDALQLVERIGPEPSYYGFRHYVRDSNLGVNFKFCRKVFSTHLRMNGVESEFIDLLQGRKPKSVFAKHYFRPDWNERTEEIRRLIKQLYREITGNNEKLQSQNQAVLLEKKSQHPEERPSHAVPMQPYPNSPYYLPPGAV